MGFGIDRQLLAEAEAECESANAFKEQLQKEQLQKEQLQRQEELLMESKVFQTVVKMLTAIPEDMSDDVLEEIRSTSTRTSNTCIRGSAWRRRMERKAKARAKAKAEVAIKSYGSRESHDSYYSANFSSTGRAEKLIKRAAKLHLMI